MWPLIGNERMVSLLQRGLEQRRLSHAYLFVGPPHVGKTDLAICLAQALNCGSDRPPCGQCETCRKIAEGKHADVQVISLNAPPGGDGARPQTEISIDQVREVQSSASLPPFEGRCRVYIFDGAEFMSIEAANCLLKTLEEPAERVVFTLLTASEELVPATVASRCQRLELAPVPLAEIEAELGRRGVEPARARLLSRLSHGCPGWAITAAADSCLLEERSGRLDRLLDIMDNDYEARFAYAARLATDFSQNRKSVHETLDLWLDWWRDLLLHKVGGKESITNVDLADELAEQAGRYSLAEIRSVIGDILSAGRQLKQNASPRLVLEVLMLNMPRREESGNGSLFVRSSG